MIVNHIYMLINIYVHICTTVLYIYKYSSMYDIESSWMVLSTWKWLHGIRTSNFAASAHPSATSATLVFPIEMFLILHTKSWQKKTERWWFHCRGSCGFIYVQSHVVLIGQVKQYFAYESQHQHGAFDKTGGFKHFFMFIPTWGKWSNLTSIFSNGLKPPTSWK